MRFVPITRNNRFLWLYKKGKSSVSPYVVVYAAPNRKKEIRIGITAGKKIGGAVSRNRAKRLIREAVYPLYNRFHQGHDYIFVARTKTLKLKSYELSKELERIMSGGGLIEKDSPSSDKRL